MNIYKKIIHDYFFLLGKFFLPDVFPQLAMKKFLKMPNNILTCNNNSGKVEFKYSLEPVCVKVSSFLRSLI